MSKCHNYDLKPAKWDTSQEQQKQRLALTTSQPGENGIIRGRYPIEKLKISPMFVVRVLAIALAIRFTLNTLMWLAIFKETFQPGTDICCINLQSEFHSQKPKKCGRKN